MRPTTILFWLLTSLSIAACTSGEPQKAHGGDAGCSLASVDLGVQQAGRFVPLHDGDTAEIVLGFQGLRMLSFAARVRGAEGAAVDVISYLEVQGSEVTVNQRNRKEALKRQSDGSGLIEEYLLFLHDAPPEALVGHDAEMDVIVRDGDCSATDKVALVLRDDDGCIDFDVVVPDAGALDASVTDGAVACE